MKLEPPAEFTGKGFPTIQDWFEEDMNWLELLPCTLEQWINIIDTNLEKGFSSQFKVEKAIICVDERAPQVYWQDFTWEIIAAFSAIIEEEQAWKQLKRLSQIGFA